MALHFADSSTDRVECGNSSELNDIAAGTIIVWHLPDGQGNDEGWAAKISGGDGWDWSAPADTDAMRFILRRIGGNINVNSTNSTQVIATGVWNYNAVAWDINGADADQKLFYGRLNVAVTEADNYTFQSVGSGAVYSDAASNFTIANIPGGGGASFDGKIALLAVWDKQLTLAQIEAQRHMLDKAIESANCVGFWNLGLYGTGVQPDWSGNGNNGTVTGATVSPHVPLSLFAASRAFTRPTVAEAALFGERGIMRGVARGLGRGV